MPKINYYLIFLEKIKKGKKREKCVVTLGSVKSNLDCSEAYIRAINKLKEEGHEIIEIVKPNVGFKTLTWKAMLRAQ